MNLERGKIHKWLTTLAVLTLLQMAIVSTTYAAPLPGGWGGDGGGGCNTYHKVQYGETLYSIGRQYGVNPQRIAEVNGLYNPDHIYAGQVLYIPCGGNNHRPPNNGGQCCGSKPGQYYPQVGYGYDFTGYYYETYYPNYQRYSYTCGYHYNCY